MHHLDLNPLDTKSVGKHLACSESLHSQREEFIANIVEAYAIVYSFADSNNWLASLEKPLIASIHIYESQKKLWNRVRQLTGTEEEHPPTDGLSAAICSGHLVAAAPKVYKQVRPEYACIENAWVKLLAHEIIHELHTRLVKVDEKMGPQWFFEGFAMHGAGQHFGKHVSSIEEALEAIRAKKRGSYAKYVAAFEFFVGQIDINILLNHAANPDFESWLVAQVDMANGDTEPSV